MTINVTEQNVGQLQAESDADPDDLADEVNCLWFEATKRQYLVGGCHGNPWHYLGNEERLRSIALLRALGRPLDWQPEP